MFFFFCFFFLLFFFGGGGGGGGLQDEVFLCPPSKKARNIALHMSISMSVSLNLVQLITQECFSPKASNLVGR